MFGMLDYRAYKLFWLIGLPFRIAGRLAFFIIVAIGIFIGHWTGYHVLVQMVVAYLAFEAIILVFNLLWTVVIVNPYAKVFFWVIDVVPSRGKNTEEANSIARLGPIVWLMKKFENDIEHWTDEDTDALAKCFNWRARWWFNPEEKIWKRAEIMQEVYQNTGKQPAELGEAEVKKLLKPYEGNWLQNFIVDQYGWNSIIAGTLIIVGILYLTPRVH
jgi:hypothetical protein